MSVSALRIALDHFTTFGDLLKFLRRRAGYTQRALAIAVGYSDTQISRLEHNERRPDLATITARFLPALELEQEPEAAERLLALAAGMWLEEAPAAGVVTLWDSDSGQLIMTLTGHPLRDGAAGEEGFRRIGNLQNVIWVSFSPAEADPAVEREEKASTRLKRAH